MRKLEKTTGVVALSYLVLIPVGGFYIYQKVKQIDEDVNALWDVSALPPTDREPTINLRGIRESIRRALG